MKNSKNIIIGVLCCMLVVMGVGYAYFSQNINVNTVGNITGDFKVVMTQITPSTSCPQTPTEACGSYLETDISSINGYTAINLNTTLFKPNDTITYTIKVENQGNIPAEYKTINNYSGDDYVNIETNIDDTVNPPITVLQPNGVGYFTVTVTLRDLNNSQFDASTQQTHSFQIIPVFEQVSSSGGNSGGNSGDSELVDMAGTYIGTYSNKYVVMQLDESGNLLSLTMDGESNLPSGSYMFESYDSNIDYSQYLGYSDLTPVINSGDYVMIMNSSVIMAVYRNGSVLLFMSPGEAFFPLSKQ